jgi:hypothetical protein
MSQVEQVKFSVIIPTMLNCVDITKVLIKNLEEEESVDEIIVIDNSNVYDINPLLGKMTPKQIRIKPYKNLYVNPSWNLGVKISKNNNIALLNDDILIPKNLLNIVSYFETENIGVLGAFEPSVTSLDDYNVETLEGLNIAPVDTRWNTFGIMMIMNKKNYIEIPDNIKIWCGDDILFHQNAKNGKLNGMICVPIKTRMSATSDKEEFNPIKENDLLIYEEYKKNNIL